MSDNPEEEPLEYVNDYLESDIDQSICFEDYVDSIVDYTLVNKLKKRKETIKKILNYEKRNNNRSHL